MGWVMAAMALVFAWMSLSMYLAAFKESDPVSRNQLMRKGFGTLVLALMGSMFAWYSFAPPGPSDAPASSPAKLPAGSRSASSGPP
jgi:hypothetical protein